MENPPDFLAAPSEGIDATSALALVGEIAVPGGPIGSRESGSGPDGFEKLLGGLIQSWRSPLVAMLEGWRVPNPVDLAQDVFAELWLSRSRFSGDWGDEGAVGAWIRGIAWNLGAAAKRAAARGPRPLDAAIEESLEASQGASAEKGLSDAEESALRRRSLRAAVLELPADQRTVILMCAVGETSVSRVAALLGVSPRSVEGRLYRARRTLAERLRSGATGALANVFKQEARRQNLEARS